MYNHLFIISVRREPSPCCHQTPDCPGPRLEDGKDYDNELPLTVCDKNGSADNNVDQDCCIIKAVTHLLRKCSKF